MNLEGTHSYRWIVSETCCLAWFHSGDPFRLTSASCCIRTNFEETPLLSVFLGRDAASACASLPSHLQSTNAFSRHLHHSYSNYHQGAAPVVAVLLHQCLCLCVCARIKVCAWVYACFFFLFIWLCKQLRVHVISEETVVLDRGE